MLILQPFIVTIFYYIYQPSKSLLLGMKCVIDRQDFQIFCLKLILIHLISGPLYIARYNSK